jgi:hypothetical protein
VGTRRRSWQNHPGNAFYRDIIIKYVDRILDKEDTTPPRVFAQKIVDIITKVQRRSLSLRADEERGGWYVMGETSALNKVMRQRCTSAEIKANKDGGGMGASAASDQGHRKKSKGKRKKRYKRRGES